MEYTDLELNKMMAELEGLSPVVTAGFIRTSSNGDYAPIERSYNKGLATHYKNTALLFDLMVKYKVELEFASEILGDGQAGIGLRLSYFKSESEIPRAIIMCILKSKNII